MSLFALADYFGKVRFEISQKINTNFRILIILFFVIIIIILKGLNYYVEMVV